MPKRTPWKIILILCSVMVFVGVRLGVKTVRITETDIIDHYVSDYLDRMDDLGFPADSSECYATTGRRFFERMVVICKHENIYSFTYSIGPWGQVLRLTKDGGI